MIFISYRHSDSAHFVDRLYTRLIRAFGENRVFKDVDSIPLGLDFNVEISKVLGKSEVVLVVIGNRWLTATDNHGSRRIDLHDDPVRIEVLTALSAEKLVVPVTIDSAVFPSSSELPDELKGLASKNGFQIRSDPFFHGDVDLLIHRIARRRLADWPEFIKQKRRPKHSLNSAHRLLHRQSTTYLLDRLVQNMQSWYNELVAIGERIRGASSVEEVDRIIFGYVNTRHYLPEVVAVRDIFSSRGEMRELVETVNAFLDHLTINTAGIELKSLACRGNRALFGLTFAPHNPFLELQHYLQKVVTFALQFRANTNSRSVLES
jgi:hypothetical protein